MEKKTTGQFLSVLRKAKGMTQRELAELLNVSDKAVSRWERDESMPDILLLPVLADIFDVTCDELLKGEKISKEHYNETPEKKINRVEALIKKSKSQFQAFSMISIGASLLGFLIAIILNFSFKKATIGFFCAFIGIIAGLITQLAFYFYFKGNVDTEDIESPVLVAYKKYIRNHTLHISYFLFIILCICLPLLLMGQISYADYIALISEQMAPLGFEYAGSDAGTVFQAGTVAIGLQLKTWLIYGGIGGAISGVLCYIINFIIKLDDARKGHFDVTANDIKRDIKNLLNTLKYVFILAILLAATYAGSKVFKNKMPDLLLKGTQFDNFEDFKEQMETIPSDMYPGVVEIRQQLDSYRRFIYGDDGEILCEYRLINDSVIDIEYGENNKLPITTYTEEDYILAKQKTEDLMLIWYVLMVLECFLVVAVYLHKILKNKDKSI